jgi:metal-responsive CopG/Arc/MetJ family transcriptional regulator
MLLKVTVSVSIPKYVLDMVDDRRKDVPRSKFLSRLLEQSLDMKEENE